MNREIKNINDMLDILYEVRERGRELAEEEIERIEEMLRKYRDFWRLYVRLMDDLK